MSEKFELHERFCFPNVAMILRRHNYINVTDSVRSFNQLTDNSRMELIFKSGSELKVINVHNVHGLIIVNCIRISEFLIENYDRTDYTALEQMEPVTV